MITNLSFTMVILPFTISILIGLGYTLFFLLFILDVVFSETLGRCSRVLFKKSCEIGRTFKA